MDHGVPAQPADQKGTEFSVAFAAVSPPTVAVYEYGCRLDPSAEDHLRDQMTRARRLYNDLAALINATIEEAKAFLSERAGDEAQELAAQLQALDQRWSEAKACDDRPALEAIAKERRELRTRWYALLHQARREHAIDVKQTFLSRIGAAVGTQTYSLRCDAVDQGLDWATANEALASALKAFSKQWPRFKPIAFRHFDDPTATVTLQFTAAGGVAVENVLLDKHSQIGISAANTKAGRRIYVPFRFVLGARKARATISGTLLYHRALPNEASITMARLVERRIGKDYKHYLQLVVRMTSTTSPIHNGQRQPLAVLHPGWYYQPEGRRLAEIASAADPGLSQRILFPVEISEMLDRARDYESRRSLLRDNIVANVLEDLPHTHAPAELNEQIVLLKRLPAQRVAPRRLARLVTAWENSCPQWQPQLLQQMVVWRREDRMLWQSSAHLARRARNKRRKFYEDVALDLVNRFDCVLINKLDLTSFAKVKDPQTGQHNELGARARSGRHDVALHELAACIAKAGARMGCNVGTLIGPVASICAHCGGSTRSATSLRDVVCNQCGAVEDRAASAAAVGFAWASGNRATLQEALQRALDEQRAITQRSATRKAKMATARAARRAGRTVGGAG